MDLNLPKTANSAADNVAEAPIPESNGVHPDSMVTIRLSEAGSLYGMEEPREDNHEEEKNAVGTRVRFETSAMMEEAQIMALGENRNSSKFDEHSTRQSSLRSASIASSSTRSVNDELDSELERKVDHVRSNSMGSISSAESAQVNWEQLDQNEKEKQLIEGADDSTAFLLARLEQENNALATNPKAGLAKSRIRSRSRPPSIQQLRRLVTDPTRHSIRYSMLPSPPPMTELEFWSALVSNYPQTAQRLPTLTSNKIRSGVPPPLRGVVWISIAGARDPSLEDEYERLCGESSPYEKLIGKDIGRSFPGVDMFRDPDGEGQKMLGKVLNAFSLWDQEIGYCQGLGFVVGPLLMHMGDKEAFCVLLRLMQHYDLRSCFLPNLFGLHLRIYQFQQLLSQHLPELSQHLDKLKIEPIYVSQWFLSFFGVTCPLPMLLRIYDVILTEGASETLMRVALSLMRRNEQKILAIFEFEEIMQLLLSRGLWDTYNFNADEMVNDFCGLSGLVTREGLQTLEGEFKESLSEDASSQGDSKPSIHSAASRFLGRFWTGSTGHLKSSSMSPSLSAPSRPASSLRRTPSKQSMASTLSSIKSTETSISTISTEATDMSRQVSADWVPQKQPINVTGSPTTTRTGVSSADKDFHAQIEDLLTALNDMQREQSVLECELEREREGRAEDRAVVHKYVSQLKKLKTLSSIPEITIPPHDGTKIPAPCVSLDLEDGLIELEGQFTVSSLQRCSEITQTKHQLQEEVSSWKSQSNEETARCTELSRQLTERERDATQANEQLREARSRIQESHRDKQRLEKTIQNLKSRKSAVFESAPESPSSEFVPTVAGGLREFRLGKSPPNLPSLSTSAFAKRASSLSTQSILVTEDNKFPNEDVLLLELVSAKTAEAVARQELEEVKGKLDSLRKLVGSLSPASPGTSSGVHGHSSHKPSPSSPGLSFAAALAAVKGVEEPVKLATPGSGGFFSGWGRRSASTSTAQIAEAR